MSPIDSTHMLIEALENLNQGITIFDADLKLLASNSKANSLLGLPPEVLKPNVHIGDLFRYNAQRGEYGSGDIDKIVQDRIDMAMQFLPHKFERTRPDGTTIEIIGNPLPQGGFVTTYTDITEFRQIETKLRRSNEQLEERVLERTLELQLAQERLKKMAVTDSLTGVANRRGLGEFFDQTIKRIRRLNKICAVLYIDLDDFKTVNDTYGHNMGDWVLLETTKRMKKCLRETDFLARIGGDEFVAIIEFLNIKENGAFVASRIIDKLSMPFEKDGSKMKIGASIGISYINGGSISFNEILSKADCAMYEAKKSGKGNVVECK